jgi:AcrR family transcriptional regulator
MALYWHFRDKAELLDGLAARLLEDVDLSVDETASWQEQLRALLGSLAGVARAHPSIVILLSTRTVASDAGLRMTEVMLDILRRAGFSPAEATQVARHAVSTVANLASGEPGFVVRDESGEVKDARQHARGVLESLPPERFPRLVEAARPLSEGIHPADYRAFGLDLLLAGIEAMAARNQPPDGASGVSRHEPRDH